MRRRFQGPVVMACATLMLGLAAAAAAQPSPPFRLTSVAINLSNVGRTGLQTVDIAIDRWSTESERQSLLSTFEKQGPEKLLDALQDTRPVGRISAPGTLAWDLRYAHHVPLDEGGTQIIIITDRPIGFWEARNQPRSIDYPFTLIDLRLRRDGTGEGKASVATKITFNKKKQVVELENYANQPVRLNTVRLVSP